MNGRKLNCWEYQNCGRGPGGGRTAEFGQCPSSRIPAMHGSNSGVLAGRACWVVSGTLCAGVVAGEFKEKANDCRRCAFYLRVEIEEGLDFEGNDVLLARYRD